MKIEATDFANGQAAAIGAGVLASIAGGTWAAMTLQGKYKGKNGVMGFVGNYAGEVVGVSLFVLGSLIIGTQRGKVWRVIGFSLAIAGVSIGIMAALNHFGVNLSAHLGSGSLTSAQQPAGSSSSGSTGGVDLGALVNGLPTVQV